VAGCEGAVVVMYDNFEFRHDDDGRLMSRTGPDEEWMAVNTNLTSVHGGLITSQSDQAAWLDVVSDNTERYQKANGLPTNTDEVETLIDYMAKNYYGDERTAGLSAANGAIALIEDLSNKLREFEAVQTCDKPCPELGTSEHIVTNDPNASYEPVVGGKGKVRRR